VLTRPYCSLSTGYSGKFLLPFVGACTICRGAFFFQEQERIPSAIPPPSLGGGPLWAQGGGGSVCETLPSAAIRVAFAPVVVVAASASVVQGPYLKDLGIVMSECRQSFPKLSSSWSPPIELRRRRPLLAAPPSSSRRRAGCPEGYTPSTICVVVSPRAGACSPRRCCLPRRRRRLEEGLGATFRSFRFLHMACPLDSGQSRRPSGRGTFKTVRTGFWPWLSG